MSRTGERDPVVICVRYAIVTSLGRFCSAAQSVEALNISWHGTALHDVWSLLGPVSSRLIWLID